MMTNDKAAQPHPSGFEVVTPRGVQQWVGDSAGSASRAPGAFGSVLGDIGDDHVRVFQDIEEKVRAIHASLADHREDDTAEADQRKCVPQRITYRIPSTFNLGQTLLWISTNIGGHLSRAQLEREVIRFWSHDSRVEPPLEMIIACLRDAHLDPLSADQSPTLSAEASFEEARDQLRDALRGGKVTMRGQPSDPSNTAEVVSQFQWEKISFSEDQHGIARAVIANRPEHSWQCLRLTSSEITDLWPVPDAATIDNNTIRDHPRKAEKKNKYRCNDFDLIKEFILENSMPESLNRDDFEEELERRLGPVDRRLSRALHGDPTAYPGRPGRGPGKSAKGLGRK